MIVYKLHKLDMTSIISQSIVVDKLKKLSLLEMMDARKI
jgi:hypothetical protein